MPKKSRVFILIAGGTAASSTCKSLGWQGLIVGITVAVVPQAVTIWGAEGIGCLKELLGRV